MELRTRILPKMLNSEVETYLQHNDLIIVPVGTVEMHGGFPLDCETVISEAFGLRMAEAADGLVLTGLPYFYAGATATGRGTVQCSIREGTAYLNSIAHSLLRQGFRRQIYISFHTPAHLTCSPMVRDFFDETGVPILYIDLTMQQFLHSRDLFTDKNSFADMIVGAYQIMGRLEDIPLVTGYDHNNPQSVDPFNDLFGLAYISGSIGYCFAENQDHLPTPDITSIQQRQKMADTGEKLILKVIERMNVPEIAKKMAGLDTYNKEVMERYPWMPSVWNKK